MGTVAATLYTVRSRTCPDLYIAEQAGSWGRMSKKEEAMKKTREWWNANLSKGWRKNFVVEKAEK